MPKETVLILIFKNSLHLMEQEPLSALCRDELKTLKKKNQKEVLFFISVCSVRHWEYNPLGKPQCIDSFGLKYIILT